MFKITSTSVITHNWIVQYAPRILLISIVALAAHDFYNVLGRGYWQEVPGWEAEWVASAIAKGQGFSFPGDHRWLFEKSSPDEYFPTAWIDPIFTYLLAGCFWLFGEYGRLVIIDLNLFFRSATILVVFSIGRQIAGIRGGLLSAVLMVLHWRLHPSTGISNSALAALMVSLSTLMLVRFLNQPNLRASLGLGIILGLTMLACPSALLFLPVAAIVLLTASLPSARQKVLAVLLMAGSAVAVISPWTLRNYLTFGEFVPVRTGVGILASTGTVALSATFKPSGAMSDVPVPWTASGPMQAVKQVMQREARRALERYQFNMLAADPPIDYTSMNEAQRDALYLTRAKEFVLRDPLTTVQLAFFKAYIFAKKLDILGLIMIGFTLITLTLGASDHRVRALFLLLLAYALPFSVIICYYNRYRIPIEPVVVVLVGVGLTLIGRQVDGLYSGTIRSINHR